MRPARIIAAAALTAAVAAGSYLAVSTASDHATPQVAPVAATPPASPAAKNPTGGVDAADHQPLVLADGRHAVLLKAIDPAHGTVTFDVVQFFRDEEAAREAAKDHQESPPPNDSYMRNVNPRLRTLPVGAGANITANQLAGSNQDIPVSLARLASLTRQGSGVFWLTVRNGEIVQVAEQWSP
jgi:Flp pilus assembly protein CpaB